MSSSVRNGTKRSYLTVGATNLHSHVCHFAHANTTSCSGTEGSVVGHLSLMVQPSGFQLFHDLEHGPMARFVYSYIGLCITVVLKCHFYLFEYIITHSNVHVNTNAFAKAFFEV